MAEVTSPGGLMTSRYTVGSFVGENNLKREAGGERAGTRTIGT